MSKLSGAFAALFLSMLLNAGQADQASRAQNTKEKKSTPLATLFGGPALDQAAVDRGQKIFGPTCGFCHGNDARGKSGPDLVRSTLVLHDEKGDNIGQVIRNGRPDRGMPAFPTMSPEQIADISIFLHSRAADASNRFGYKIGDLITGEAKKGEAFFKGAGGCESCHSPSGDLAHVASKYEPVELQRRFLYPVPNWMDMFMGKATKPPVPTKVTVELSSGERIAGTLEHLDEFTVALRDSGGWYRSFSRPDVKVDLQNPRAAHEALLPKYTDDEMHDMLAYLETLK
jgi:cytochrome c oxidase cbb3-type subunit III